MMGLYGYGRMMGEGSDIMKKLLPVLLMLVLLAGCGRGTRIDGGTWEFSVALTEGGNYAAYAPERVDADDGLFADAEAVEMTLQADDGEILLSVGGDTYHGTYSEADMTGDARIYAVTVGDVSGTAAVSETEYYGKASEETLVISIGGYSLYFYRN